MRYHQLKETPIKFIKSDNLVSVFSIIIRNKKKWKKHTDLSPSKNKNKEELLAL